MEVDVDLVDNVNAKRQKRAPRLWALIALVAIAGVANGCSEGGQEFTAYMTITGQTGGGFIPGQGSFYCPVGGQLQINQVSYQMVIEDQGTCQQLQFMQPGAQCWVRVRGDIMGGGGFQGGFGGGYGQGYFRVRSIDLRAFGSQCPGSQFF